MEIPRSSTPAKLWLMQKKSLGIILTGCKHNPLPLRQLMSFHVQQGKIPMFYVWYCLIVGLNPWWNLMNPYVSWKNDGVFQSWFHSLKISHLWTPSPCPPFCHGHCELHKGQGKRQRRQRRQRSRGEAAATLKLFKAAAAMGCLSYYEPWRVYIVRTNHGIFILLPQFFLMVLW